MALAISFFVASLIGLALLFTLKSIETKRQRTFAPGLRDSADRAAVAFKSSLVYLGRELAKMPPALMYLGRYILHELALGAARIARSAETQLHNVADMISHKRGFEKKEPRSEFLRHMQENRTNDSSDQDELDEEKDERHNSEAR